MTKTIGAVVFVFCLTGCATAAQHQSQLMVQTATTATAELKTCTAAVLDSPEADPIREHIPVDVRDATLDQMMDKHKANTGEIAAIKLVYPEVTKCRRTAIDKVGSVLPGVAVIFTDEIRNIDARLIELIEQKISWGEYITGFREEAVAASTLMIAETEKIESGLERSHEAELARRQAAANALMQYSQTQQMINAMNRPHVDTATCTAMGNTVNCMGVSQ